MRMPRALSIISGALLCCSGFAQATTTTITSTGNCPADPAAVQNAINNAAPGDTIQLLPGPSSLAFNFTCLSNGTAATIQTLALTIEGFPGGGPTVLQGPGVSAGERGFVILSDDVTVTGIDFQGFAMAIFVANPALNQSAPGAANVSVTHCEFENNGYGVFPFAVSDHFRFTNNVVHVPAPSGPSAGANFGIALTGSDMLIADNTIIGPGPSGLVTSLQQFIDGTGPSEGALVQTVGILQFDPAVPESIRGRISGNTLTGLDYGLQSSSNFGIVTQNVATNCEIGMALSNDVDDRVAHVTDSLVSLNKSVHNTIGFVVFSGSQNTVVLNNFSDNTLAGLFFVANPGGAASVGNRYGCNQGTVRNADGNQVLEACSQNAQG